MPALTSVVIADGESTPVDHTFNPQAIDKNGVAKLNETDGVPIGDNLLSVSSRETDSKYKSRVVLQMPVTVTETVNGVDREKVERVSYADVTFTFDKSSSTQERKNSVRLMASALAGDTFIDGIIIDLEGAWG